MIPSLTPGEVIYLRDEDSGKVWTVCAGPIWEEEQYTVRHGRGYTKFSHHSHGLGQELTVLCRDRIPLK